MIALANILETNTKPPDPKLLDDFMLFTNDLDTSRGQNFASVNSELLAFIEASGVRWNDETKFARRKIAEANTKSPWGARFKARLSWPQPRISEPRNSTIMKRPARKRRFEVMRGAQERYG